LITRALALGCLAVLGALACDGAATFGTAAELATGTWGGENAGVIVSAGSAHVHIGCTNGDFPAPIELDEAGRFSVAGDYLLDAFPVAVGPTMPARFAGVLRRGELVITVAVNDTIDDELVVLGPASVRLGREPELGPCPICIT
jgi:hypothetical protein